ncbi:FAD-binding oxidoreductase [Nitrospiraceae bacterium AH_259_D15_M11_P09]|nr:FAD-binding oxidoreductase [Nitrospiraceae bacterium AH_259_D15_M11_P09]
MPLIVPTKKRPVAADLRRALGPEKVRDDSSTLTAYAVDASIYKLMPQAVVLAESEADLQAVAEYAVRTGVPLTPRAAGTNLTGSAIGSGIIVDTSRLNRIVEVNPEERWARVQPGIVFAELNARLAPYGLMFGPDPSSGEMCKLGGMVANNSSGPHTLRYGSVKDNVEALRVWIQPGGWLAARPYDLTSTGLQALLRDHPPLSDILGLVQHSADFIRAKQPTVSKNSSGYNLFGLADGLGRGLFDVPKLFVGSEGTLGIISEATIRLVTRPKTSATAFIHFRHLDEVGEAVVHLLRLAPSALEVMDANTLNLIGRAQYGIPADAAATLLADFDSDQPEGHLRDLGARLGAICRRYRLASDPIVAFDREAREKLWAARKALYPTLYRYDSKKKPINFVDDVVVPAERLSELIRYLEKFFGDQRVPVAIFGHIGNGNAHIVPLLDVSDAEDFAKMVHGYREVHETVLTRFGGSICGEHGDGRVRAELVRRMFGDELYALFLRVKRSLDPSGVFNPGVKISETPFTEHIDYTRLSKACATCGKCNSVCPVYDVFQSEDMSSRGWYEIVTAADYSYLDSKRVVEACVNCKSCRTVCPAGVDVSDLILKRRAEHPNRMAGLLFALHARPWLFEPLLKAAARTQGIWNRPWPRLWLEWVTRPIMRRIAETARIPRDMVIPPLACRHLRERYVELTRPLGSHNGKAVAYFHGCAANYLDDGVGDAVIAVLRRHGVNPALPPQRCSGTPIQTYGHVNLMKEGARVNLSSLEPYETVVTGCASCTLMLKDYSQLFQGEPEQDAAERLARRVQHISEFVAESTTGPTLGSKSARPARKVTYHSSCHLRAAGVTAAPRRVLAALPGVELIEMQDADRCAGGAGTYILKDYETAQRIFERKKQAIAETRADVVATSCPACMIQLNNGLRGRVLVKHVAELLRDAYEVAPNAGGGPSSSRR